MFFEVFANVFNPSSLLVILLGVLIGNVFGCIPGLNTPIAVALVIPFTLLMDPVMTVCILMGIYMGGVSGGLVSAVLLRIPGTAAAIATVFDGYPMAQKGEAIKALNIGVAASFFGGIFSSLALLCLAPTLSKLAIGFGPWEYFGSTILALSMVTALIKGNFIKGCIALGLGLLLKSFGMSPIDGVAYRFTFGNVNLENGFSLIAIIIGTFALPEIINNASRMKEQVKASSFKGNRFFNVLPFKDWLPLLKTFFRSSVIGTAIGILPGLGGGPAAMLSYSTAKTRSKHPEEFGNGSPEGIAAAESANNATTGGALIPMLSLAVPGDTATAVIMGALAMQGIAVGPNLSLTQPVLFETIILAVFVANIFMFIYQASTLRIMAKIIEVPKMYLMPLIVVFCVTGIFCLNSNIFDLYYTIFFVVLGFILEKNGYPIIPLIMGMVLGGTVEENLRRSIVYYGSFGECLKIKSVGTLFFILAIAIPVYTVISSRIKQKKATEKA